jgi:hypothetical protein
MKYAAEIGSVAMIYMPSFIQIFSAGVQKLIGADTQTHKQHGDLVSLLLYFQNKESRLKTVVQPLLVFLTILYNISTACNKQSSQPFVMF